MWTHQRGRLETSARMRATLWTEPSQRAVRIRTLPIVLCVAAAIAAAAGEVGASQPAAGDVTPNEIMGLELTPLWAQAGKREGSDDWARPLALGVGATARFLRINWQHVYITPLQAGFAGKITDELALVSLHVTTEVGLRRRFARGSGWELGLGIGAGSVEMEVGTDCDGSCSAGGRPVVVSPVFRCALNSEARYPLRTVARALVPLSRKSSESFGGYNVGYGLTILLGVELAVPWFWRL